MKTTSSYLVLMFLIPFFALSQVGIGTVTPNAQLEIKATNQATPNNTDGILIPKVDEFPIVNPGANQDGMMFFVTGSGTPAKGFYYWNNVSTTWILFTTTGAQKIDNLSDGKSDSDGSNDGSSVFFGVNSGLNDDSSDNRNIGMGYSSLYNNTNGDNNVAIGWFSLYSHISGGYNTAIGNNSLRNNTTGIQNTAQGGFSLSGNTTGNLNTASGYATLIANTTGTSNTASGHSSLYNNTLGNNNTSSGRFSLYSNLTGNGNTSFGLNSGYSNATGDKNVFLGFAAGYNETGSNTLYIENSGADADNALIYGEFGTSSSTAGNILRVNGELQLGNSLANRYSMPTADGNTNQVLQTNGSGGLSWVDASSLGTDKNALNEAYNEGGAGAGRTIMATDGAVTISGEDGFLVTGILGSGDLAPSGAGIKMFFNPRKAAFRAGEVTGTQWDDTSIGESSVALGANTTASGRYSTATGLATIASGDYATATGWSTLASGEFSTAMGGNTDATGRYSFSTGWNSTTASGDYSIAMGGNSLASGVSSIALGSFTTASGNRSMAFGYITSAYSYAETVFGAVNTLYTPNSTIAWDVADRLFVIGNGTDILNKSNALTIYKSGLMNINDEYNMPLTDGAVDQVMQTDGSGNVSWSTLTDATTASNGLTLSSSDIALGGSLNQNTTFSQGAFNMTYNLNNTGDFIIQDNGTNHFEVRDNGSAYFGGATYWNSGSTTGTLAASLFDIGGNGAFTINNGGTIQHFIYGSGTTVFNNQGIDVDFQISGDNNANLFYIDAGNDRIGVLNNAPSYDIHLKQSNNSHSGSGGIAFESALANINWKIFHSGSAISFAENGIRRAYISAGTGAYVQTSDRNLKKNINYYGNTLEKLSEINIYTYHYIDQPNTAKKTLGVMAQEIQPQFPELVSTDEEGNLGIIYSGLGVIAIKAIKEQQIIIAEQQVEIDILKNEIEAIKAILLQK